jgi:hypothetical protein
MTGQEKKEESFSSGPQESLMSKAVVQSQCKEKDIGEERRLVVADIKENLMSAQALKAEMLILGVEGEDYLVAIQAEVVVMGRLVETELGLVVTEEVLMVQPV